MTASENVRSILLVDDDEMLLAYLAEVLQFAGFQIWSATNGQDALQVALDQEPSLALLDINMPGMSGLELARHLRHESAIPFMFLSSLDDMEIVKQATRYGAVGYLVKPVNQSQLLPAITAALARADDIRQLRNNEMSLTAALDAGRETSMAVGLLMMRFRLTRHLAFQKLRDQSRSQRRKISEVAKEMLTQHESSLSQPEKS
ncbi:response regulator [Massilia sp. W12]|uniref:ANTAR domain-containing response regulator n=1 Tax=Massilia sp. W12 TaxID=3126507 RepID=UPI0030D3F63F